MLLGDSTSAGQIAGVVAVTVGILLVCGVGVADASSDRGGVALALATAVFIAGYTLVDKEGLQHAAPIPYIELVLIGPAFVYGAFVARTRGTAAQRKVWRMPRCSRLCAKYRLQRARFNLEIVCEKNQNCCSSPWP